MHDDQRPYESAVDLFCIEPRQDDTAPEDKASFWARLAAAALREAHDARAERDAAVTDGVKQLLAMADERNAVMDQRDALEDRLAMLHDVAVLAADARAKGDLFSAALHADLIVTNLAGPAAVRGVGTGPSVASDIALAAAAEAMQSMTTSDNTVCSDCDGGGWVTDGDDRLVRCECSERES